MNKTITSKTRKYVFSNVYYFVLALLLVACQNDKKSTENASTPLPPMPAAGADYFLDITSSAGIDFVHSIGDDHLTNIVESVGGGAAFLDYDQDGWMDIYAVSGNFHERLSDQEFTPDKVERNQLYRNRGDGTFENVTEKAGVGDDGFGMGITVADCNNDGFPDMYISNHGPNVLYLNNADGTFTDIAQKAGVAGDESSVGAVWLDFDNNGLVDLYVGNYLSFDPDYKFFYAPDGFPGPMSFDGEIDRLYKNLGNGKFEDVTEAMGVFNPNGRAMGVGAADYDNDGFMDIYVANDHMVNFMYHNQGGSGFKEVGIPSGTAFNQVGEGTISMAVDFGDYNGDGLLDIWVSDDGYCSLYQNQGNGVFTEMAYPSGIAVAAAQHVGWSSSFIDFDNDGDQDIFKVNGELKHLYGQEDQLFENDGNGKFNEVSAELGKYFKEALVGRGACFGDYDNDGDLDVFIVNLHDRAVLLRNDHGNDQQWIMLKLVGTSGNKDALGAKVKVCADGKCQFFQKKSTSGYLSQNDPRIHVGLGTVELVDSLEITWLSGKVQKLEQVKANQLITITEL
ncbi:MAG: CRTAC1 family protein [Cyclobacteriaceae bacterium]|nr:CRTAC1 family protein [Cyclobacteriaceae bacterium]